MNLPQASTLVQSITILYAKENPPKSFGRWFYFDIIGTYIDPESIKLDIDEDDRNILTQDSFGEVCAHIETLLVHDKSCTLICRALFYYMYNKLLGVDE